MNDIEEKFYKTFGIEKRCYLSDVCEAYNKKCDDCPCSVYIYPKLTDRILLELICILNTVIEPDLGDINYARLRTSILVQCIEAVTEVDWGYREPTKEEFILDVQSLFKGGAE